MCVLTRVGDAGALVVAVNEAMLNRVVWLSRCCFFRTEVVALASPFLILTLEGVPLMVPEPLELGAPALLRLA